MRQPAHAGEIETWLDFHIGRMIRGQQSAERSAGADAGSGTAAAVAHERTGDPVQTESSALMNVVVAALEERGWEHSLRPGGWRWARVQGPHLVYDLHFRTDDERQLVVVYCLLPLRVPEERRAAICETIARANYGLVLGGFELDLADGELRFKVGVDVEGSALVPLMVHNMISMALACCDRYFPALAQVLYAGAEPAAVIRAVEADGEGGPPAEADAPPAADEPTGPELDELLRILGIDPEASGDEAARAAQAPDASDAPGGATAASSATEQRRLDPKRDQAHLRGCLLGGAVGDALGAPVEFLSLERIRQRFGPDGIQELDEAFGRVGAITDDTQMTLFTAEGLLRAPAWTVESATPAVHRAYLRWLHTQESEAGTVAPPEATGWLLQQRALHARRAPGRTCLAALRSGRVGTPDSPLNDSKGCGGVMRVAPVALLPEGDAFALGCATAAITHGHPSGYLAAGALALILRRVIEGELIPEAVLEAIARLEREPGHEECTRALSVAMDAWRALQPPEEAIPLLGKGWVAEEALAIGVYAALAGSRTFAEGVRMAVNHDGDSDSTGAIAGQLLGAFLGVEAIPARWLAELELRSTIERVADDLLVGGPEDTEWRARYPAA